MREAIRWSLVVAVLGAILGTPVQGDQFELLDGRALTKLLEGPQVANRASLSFSDIGAMPALLPDSRAALVVVRTDLGNPARLLLVPELRKPPVGTEGPPRPILVVERLDTFDSGDLATRLSSRRDVALFDGMPIDLDTGQVVPPGQGGDLVFRTDGDNLRLEPLGSTRLFTLTVAPTFEPSETPRPSPGRAIVPGDFAGHYRLFANGQWSGTLDLKVAARGIVTGRFRSDLHGTTYPVTGQVALDQPGLLRFAISLPRARQEFDGYLYGEGKGAMAGTLTLLDRTFGFFAVREGGKYAPEGRDLGPLAIADTDQPRRLTLELASDGAIRLAAQSVPLDQLAATLKPLAEPVGDAPAWVLIVASPDLRMGGLAPVVAAIHEAGIATIRVDQAAATDGSKP